jgi:hypothetical protein
MGESETNDINATNAVETSGEFTFSCQVGDRIYNHSLGADVVIDSISLTPQKQLRYHYKTDEGVSGVARADDLSEPPNIEDVPDLLYINLCAVGDIVKSFPNLPGGKQKLAREIIKTRNETPFDGEINFIERMTEIEPKVEWAEISHKLKYDLPETTAV